MNSSRNWFQSELQLSPVISILIPKMSNSTSGKSLSAVSCTALPFYIHVWIMAMNEKEAISKKQM